jgi:hypothetical protein
MAAKAHSTPTPNAHDEVMATTVCTTRVSPLDRAGIIFIVAIRIVDGSSRILEQWLLPLQIVDPPELGNRKLRRRQVTAAIGSLIDRHAEAVRAAALIEVTKRVSALGISVAGSTALAQRREAALLKRILAERQPLVQLGLFDRRLLRQRQSELQLEEHLEIEHRRRLNELNSARTLLIAQPLQIALVLLIKGPRRSCSLG